MFHRSLIAAIVAAVGAGAASAQSTPSPVPSNDEIRKILVERIDTHHQAVGIVVGVVEPTGRRIVSYGAAAKTGGPTLDGDTVFEIGSITKVFTSLLLVDAVKRGEVALNDPIAKHLPSTVTVPTQGRAITLEDLASHRSALPRLPTNLVPKDPSNPYADYTVENLYQFLSAHKLTRDVGASYEYSNLGAGLLGHLLARRTGMDYESLVKARITGPLGMTSTSVTLSPALRGRLAAGYDASLSPTNNWDLPTLAGAGALRSTAHDMMTLLEAFLGYRQSALAPAMAEMVKPRGPAAGPNTQIALGWHISTANEKTIVWHNGGTGGYRSFLAFDPAARAGVVLLANAGTIAGPDDIGRHLLDAKSALLAAGSPALAQQKQRTAITVSNEVFDRYVGRYQLAPSTFFTISRDGNKFLAQLTGQPSAEIFAEVEKEFFYKIVDAQLTFETGAQGKAVALVLHQNGVNQRAPRIEGEPVAPKEITLDVAVLEGYVGRYEVAPGITFTITRQNNHLFAQLTGQPSLEIFASAPREFFYKVVNAQLTFEEGADGRATAVVLHQFGRDVRAARAN
jgi:CubicO group peptidase (beta-lactamase class C family)